MCDYRDGGYNMPTFKLVTLNISEVLYSHLQNIGFLHFVGTSALKAQKKIMFNI